MNAVTLTEQYVPVKPQEVVGVYIYRADGFHTGGAWWDAQEQGIEHLRPKVQEAIEQGREVRITNGADYLVFHAKDGLVLYPQDQEKFWETVTGKKEQAQETPDLKKELSEAHELHHTANALWIDGERQIKALTEALETAKQDAYTEALKPLLEARDQILSNDHRQDPNGIRDAMLGTIRQVLADSLTHAAEIGLPHQAIAGSLREFNSELLAARLAVKEETEKQEFDQHLRTAVRMKV